MSEISNKIRAGNRRAIGKAITLIESSRPDHQKEAQDLLSELLPYTGCAMRIGITGVPGVGKSTFIESFGKMLTKLDIKVAVLAVDPSSKISGGSILGDKTRMEELARDDMAFIRPTPSKTTLGGIARYTREAMLVLEAAGYEVVIIETIGVGQSEVAVADLVDMFLLLHSPGTGDELQGIKRGIMELADLVVVNKADGDFLNATKIAVSELRNALHFMKPKNSKWSVKVLEASALKRTGLREVWENIKVFKEFMTKEGEIDRRRATQNVLAIWSELGELVNDQIRIHKPKNINELETAVRNAKITPQAAAKELLKYLLKDI